MNIAQPDLPVSCNRRTETVSMGTMNGSRSKFSSSGTSIARLAQAITTAAITYSTENH